MSQIKFYITTSIIYTNAKPHIGFALELIQADAVARFHRILGDDVFFLTGSDENGIKNQRAARDAGEEPQKFVDRNTAAVKELIKKLSISNDDYIRTTDKKRHWPAAQKIWKLLEKSGDIYKKNYKGYYCTGCESFKTEKELENGICPLHNRKPEIVEEENYFFRLSKYADKIIKLIESDQYHVVPKARKNELLSFLKTGLEDVSFSRAKESLSWGIPVPDDSSQTMYVWCDALTNYLSGIGYISDEKKFKKYWPADIHVVGKDIIRFHAVFWPAMLISAGLPLPKELFVHGFITSQGKKMSKSIGNVIDPFVQIEKYGADAFRYFLLNEIPSADDGNYSEEAIIKKINSNLAGDLGNLVYRVLTLVEKSGLVDDKREDLFKSAFSEIPQNYKNHFDDLKFHEAIAEAWKIVNLLNKYINDEKPWEINDKKRLSNILYNLLEYLRIISILLYPFIPSASVKIMKQLGLGEKDIKWDNLKWGYLKISAKIKKGEILFNKIK